MPDDDQPSKPEETDGSISSDEKTSDSSSLESRRKTSKTTVLAKDVEVNESIENITVETTSDRKVSVEAKLSEHSTVKSTERKTSTHEKSISDRRTSIDRKTTSRRSSVDKTITDRKVSVDRTASETKTIVDTTTSKKQTSDIKTFADRISSERKTDVGKKTTERRASVDKKSSKPLSKRVSKDTIQIDSEKDITENTDIDNKTQDKNITNKVDRTLINKDDKLQTTRKTFDKNTTTKRAFDRNTTTKKTTDKTSTIKKSTDKKTASSTTENTAEEYSAPLRHQKGGPRPKAKVETDVEKIVSPYGVGVTDENGLPLFGLKALKRRKQQQQEEPAGIGSL